MTSKSQYKEKQRLEAIAMLNILLRGLKNGTLEVESHGYWRAGTVGKYIYRVDVFNRKEIENPDES